MKEKNKPTKRLNKIGLIGLVLIIELAIAGYNKVWSNESKDRYVTAQSGLNLRSSPDKSSKIITLVPYGSKVTVEKTSGNKIIIDEIEGEWVNVKFGNKTGWVFSGFLQSSPLADSDKNRTLVLPDGAKYTGQVKNSKPHGQGTASLDAEPISPGYSGYEYIGQWENGKKHGEGTMALHEGGFGDKYTGQWKNDKYHGQGKYTWNDHGDGGAYEGQFKDGYFHGKGTITWYEGIHENDYREYKYTGQFKDGKKHGQGTLYDKSGKVLKKGTWQEDEFAGK